MTSIGKTVDSYLSSYNIGDVDGIVSLFADDATLEDPVGSAPRVGKQAIRAFVTEAVGYKAQLDGPKCLLVAGNEAAFKFDVSFEDGAAENSFQVIDTIRVNDQGLIVSLRAYLNLSDFPEALLAQ